MIDLESKKSRDKRRVNLLAMIFAVSMFFLLSLTLFITAGVGGNG